MREGGVQNQRVDVLGEQSQVLVWRHDWLADFFRVSNCKFLEHRLRFCNGHQ